MRMRTVLGSMLLIALAAGAAYAQDPVPSLQDLVGAKGASGEEALKSRGYNFIRVEKSGDSSYTYWQESENGQCVTVRTVEGRYASIVYAPAADCSKPATAAHPAGSGTGTGFDTICGVIVGGENYRYRCKVEDHFQDGRKTHSVLKFPDQTLKMVWKPANQVELHFEGMVPQTVKYTTYEGETNFKFEDKTYFYISNQDAARMEVQNFKD